MKKRTKISDYSLKKNRKGLSMVVSVLLIIVLVLVATGIVWVVVRNVIQKGAGSLSLSGLTLNLEILSASLDGNNVNVNVKRNPGAGKLLGIKFVFSDGTSSKTAEETVSMAELDEESFSFNLIDLEIPNANEVSIALIFESEGGDEILGDIIDTVEFREEVGGNGGNGGDGELCGNFIIDSEETCDDGKHCSDGTQCTEDAECIGIGDELCQPRDGDGCSSTCAIEGAGPECGNGILETGEICDDGNIIDGDGCAGDCSACESGYKIDGSGGCILIQVIAAGMIDNVWPPGSGIYFDDDILPQENGLYYGYATYFPTVDATQCFLIVGYSYDGAVYSNAIVELILLQPLATASSDAYEIWESIADCQNNYGF